MISLRYYLDCRKAPRKMDGRWPLRLVVCKRGATAMMGTQVYLKREEWDADAQRVARPHPQRAGLNNYLDQLRMKLEEIIRQLVLSGEAAPLGAAQIRDLLAERVLDSGPGLSLADYYRRIQDEKTPQTALHFANAWKAFCKVDKRLQTLPLAALTPELVRRIDRGLLGAVSIGTRNNYIAKLTQVAKRAHREGLLQEDAGREVRLQYVIPKSRALTAEQLRAFFALEPATERARHTFASLVIETGGTMEILAGALGHAYGPRITAGYVTLQQRQVDEAVRRVFDYIAG